MVFTDKFKTFVARSLVGGNANNALTKFSPTNQPSAFVNSVKHALEATTKLFEEREWQCPCGHKFRAAGEWVACAPIYCEVPSCPNPKYYIDGPGRALLEANPSGVKLKEANSTDVTLDKTRKETQEQSCNKPENKSGNTFGNRFK